MILIFGGTGLIGSEILALLSGQNVVAPTREECDIADLEQVASLLWSLKPSVVINAAAYTHVDHAEQDKYLAYKINSSFVEFLAKTCSNVPSVELVVHISSDYVFGGEERGEPYREDDRTGPIQTYGLTKLLGEEFFLRQSKKPHLMVRTSWVYGPRRPSFPEAIIRNLKTSNNVPVVVDQYGFPTHARDVAGFIVQSLTDKRLRGVFHVSGSGDYVPSRFDQARVIAEFISEEVGIELKVKKYLTDDLTPRIAHRPTFSALNCAKAGILAPQYISDWKIRLVEHLLDLKQRGALWKS